MKFWYVAKQGFLKTLVFLTAILLIGAMAWLVSYYYKKPSNSSIYLDGYSSIKFDQVDCQSIDTGTDIYSFPIVLYYFQTPDAYTNFQVKNGSYSAKLDLWNTEAIYLTIDDETIQIQNPEHTEINIQAKTFDWKSKVSSDEFRFLEKLEFNRLYGDSVDGNSSYPDDIFDWIVDEPLRIRMGLCGDELIYFPAEKGVGFTNLKSIAVSTTPILDFSPSNTKVALLFRFGNVVNFSVDGKNYSTDDEIDEIQLRVIQKNHATTSGFNFIATGLNDPDIESCYTDQIKPGFVCTKSMSSNSDPADELLKIYGNAQSLTIIEPIGYGMQRFAKTDLPEKTTELAVSAQVGNVEISQQSPSIPLVLTGNRLSAQANGFELFPSPWEKLPSELKAVWFTVFASLLTTLLSVGFQLSPTLKQFWKWFTSKIVYKPPVTLNDDVYIFKLINGKMISGIMKPIEGRSTYRVFVLTEVREWDKDNWSEVLPTEVRVPQNQIEMYYKAHP